MDDFRILVCDIKIPIGCPDVSPNGRKKVGQDTRSRENGVCLSHHLDHGPWFRKTSEIVIQIITTAKVWGKKFIPCMGYVRGMQGVAKTQLVKNQVKWTFRQTFHGEEVSVELESECSLDDVVLVDVDAFGANNFVATCVNYRKNYGEGSSAAVHLWRIQKPQRKYCSRLSPIVWYK